ncbi:hypothetical protein [Piscinibacterium candidicorallinum]|uniref:ABC-2 type transport system permease protein n=1 Tax=Piscinibacterium candidicorallinum TaxID=1793872 RepID=A0ABV7H8Q5_9BURK
MNAATSTRSTAPRWLAERAVLGMLRHVASWPTLLLVLLVFGGFAAFMVRMTIDRDRGWLISTTMGIFPVLALLLLTLAVAVPYTAMRMQVPNTMLLVPTHRSALWRVLASSWYGCLIVTALWCGLAIAAYGTAHLTALAGFMVASSLITVAMCGFSRPMLFFALSALMLVPQSWRSTAFAALQHALEQLGTGRWLLALAWIVALRYILAAMVFKRREANAAASSLMQRPRGATQNAAYAQIKPQGGRWAQVLNFSAWAGIQQRWSLRWPVDWRLALAMGPGFSPVAVVAYIPVVLMMLAAIYAMGAGRDRAFDERDLMNSVFMFTVVILGGSGSNFVQGLALTKTEQALACLLPGAPNAVARGRWFARAVVRSVVLNTGLALGLILLAAQVPGIPSGTLALSMVLFFVGTVSFDMALALQSPRRFADPGKGVSFFLQRFFAFMAVYVLVTIGRNSLHWVAPAVLAWGVLCTGVAIWLYRKRAQEIGALPAGNFG